MEDVHLRRARPRVIHGFLPLPPISASPICTPTSTSSRGFYFGDDCTTASTTPSSDSHLLPPTWISTPPTPPPKLVRRSVTCVAKRPSSVKPSESFPTSLSPRPRLKRRASVPDLTTPKPSTIFHISHLISEENDDERLKDDTRRYHALLELLSTELSYVRDLRTLATVYLPNLATISIRTPLSSRTSSFSSLSPLQMTYIAQKDKERTLLFSANELDLLTRNVTEIYQFHDTFIEELGDALGPLGFHFSPDFQPMANTGFDNVDAAIAITSTKFATEEKAMDIVRRVTHQYPSEWDTYETFCSSQLEDTHTPSSPVSARSLSQECLDEPGPVQDRKRTSSLDSLRKSRRSKSKELTVDLKQEKQRRLSLIDYLIKPIQRICKYPLLLDQLATRKGIATHNRSGVNVVVQSAALAMKHVASLVDEARHQQEVSLQSSLIISRISKQIPSRSQSTSDLIPQPEVLTPSFLSSLGTCLLAGSLDVLHNQAYNAVSTTAVAKYMGAFLYPGGYFILVKVKGKSYEPRHWFRLADFDLVDLGQNFAMLPFSFSLSCSGHDFEFAASCQREKMAWIAAIRESLRHPSTSWINEPLSSLQVDGKGDLIPSALEGPFETINALPTIYSVPDLKSSSPELVQALPDTFSAYATSKLDPIPSRFPSRRTSMASIFSSASDADTILIRRSTAAARSQVDLGLEDVLSEQCVTARSYATSHEEALFQASRVSHASATKASGGLGSHLRKHESFRVPRRKKHNSMDDVIDPNPTIRAKSLASRTRRKHVSMTSTTFEDVSPSFLASPDASQTSSISLSLDSLTHESATKRAVHINTSRSRPTSLYNNVRGLFASRPAPPSSPEPTSHWHTNEIQSRSFFKRWVSTSRHRHAHSAPDQIVL